MSKAFYASYKWRKRAKKQLLKEPFCKYCLAGYGQANGRSLRRAKVADHISPLWKTWNEFITSPLQSLCIHCHNTNKTKEDMILKKRESLFKLETAEV